MRAASYSAIRANIPNTTAPCAVVVSTSPLPSDRTPTPRACRVVTMSMRSRIQPAAQAIITRLRQLPQTPDEIRVEFGLDLHAAGCERIFNDQLSGVGEDPPGLRELLAYVRAGDTVSAVGAAATVVRIGDSAGRAAWGQRPEPSPVTAGRVGRLLTRGRPGRPAAAPAREPASGCPAE